MTEPGAIISVLLSLIIKPKRSDLTKPAKAQIAESVGN